MDASKACAGLANVKRARHRGSIMAPGSFIDERQVIEACDRLVDFAAWPRNKVDYRGWLDNFSLADRSLAVFMLSRFTFLSHQFVDHLFSTAFQTVSNTLGRSGEPFTARRTAWRQFCDEVIVVPVLGENPNPSDSGWGFARKARQLLGISEDRLMSPTASIAAMVQDPTRPVVFVDDFVGSGAQFLRTWRRLYPSVFGPRSFASLSHQGPIHYCNVMMTEYGRSRIVTEAPSVSLATGNLIPRNHNFACMASAMWPKGLNLRGAALIRRIGAQLGFTESDGSLRDWRGFHRLGLGIAFEDSVPDANLPLFFSDANGWRPLVRRS